MDKRPKGKQEKRQQRRIERGLRIREDIRSNELEQDRTEALVTARALSLVGLPRRRTDDRYLVRTLRLGKDLWLRLEYSTSSDGVLPYGADRFVLAGVQHLACERKSPIVYFEQVSELLKLFDLPADGHYLRLLRDRFKRLADLHIRLRFAETEDGLSDASAGDSILMIKGFVLPTREQIRERLRAVPLRQMTLPGLELSEAPSPYGVLLSSDFWEHLKQPKNHLLLRLDVLRNFVDRPIGWDYASFLSFRCGWAQTESVVPHEALMSMFKDGKEHDSAAIKRLLGYHAEIMTFTAGRLKAELRQVGHFPRSPKGGNQKARWELWVGPSQQIVWSGKKDEFAAAPGEET
jgi:hypothetical protein